MNESPSKEILECLYRGLLHRDPDPVGITGFINEINSGVVLEQIIKSFLISDEFAQVNNFLKVNPANLPNLTEIYPDKYSMWNNFIPVYNASSDDDFFLIENLIDKHRYYDRGGVWTPKIDFDKRLTASIVKGLGAKSCLELGCFTGPVLSLLEDSGLDICGVDVSHLAFVAAYENVKQHLKYGSLLSVGLEQKFDVFLGMDILEHLNPLDFDKYLARIADLVNEDGFAYINSPMIGPDDVFGEPFEVYLPEWREAGDNALYRQMVCDQLGWPTHGHLVWAGPKWWEDRFRSHGLVRDRQIERHIHSLLDQPYFRGDGLARGALFVLKHEGFEPDFGNIAAGLSREISFVLASR